MLQKLELIPELFFDPYGMTLLAFTVVISFFMVLTGTLRLYFLSNNHKNSKSKSVDNNPLVSIHLPVCNEPPELVIKTIESIKNLNYENFELLVISNNTSNENLWKPIEDYVMSLDARFKFLHVDKLEGYKAGALNFGLDFTSKCANYIFTVDADYILEKDALNIAVGTIQKLNVQLLQFPQAYRNVSVETSGMEINYKHYFDCYLSSKKSSILALPTGTLTLIERQIFENGYQWPTDSITEDTSLGVELVEKDLKLAFCNTVIGRGIMPLESADFGKQFKRWVFGNFQVLTKVWKTKRISLLNKIHLSTLLTAWLNLLGFVIVMMVAAIPLLFVDNPLGELIFYLCIGNIFLHCLIQTIIYHKISHSNTRRGWNGFLVHLGLLEIGAFYWMHYFISNKKPFVRTNKFLKDNSTTNRINIFPILFLGMSSLCFILNHNLIAFLIGVFGLQLLYAKFHKDKELIWSKFNFYKIGR
jgi:cellulose synthase/poly-beta-1,6-N-acetylglucosamine synthase-like glycosyltransferase